MKQVYCFSKNAKKFFLSILFFAVYSYCFSQESGFVYTSSLRIRDQPRLDSNIIGICDNNVIIYKETGNEIVYKNRVISIYDKKGSMEMRDGIWNYWYKISEHEEYWINAYYVAIFPILFRYDITVSGADYVIYEINGNSIKYDMFHGYDVVHDYARYWESRYDTGLFKYLINEDYAQRLRLGELIKHAVKQIDQTIPYSVDMKTVKLFYDMNRIMTRPYDEEMKSRYAIIGRPERGNMMYSFYTAIDRNYFYDFDFGKGTISVELFKNWR